MKNVTIKFTTDKGEKLQIGDVITISNGEKIKEIKVSWDNIPTLINCGIIKLMKVESGKIEIGNTTPTDIEYYIEKLSDRLGWHYNKTVNYLNTLDELNPLLATQLLLKEVALEIDSKYSGHIKERNKVWVINSFNGEVAETFLPNHTNLKCVSLFRTREDAELAKTILQEVFDNVYGESKD